MFAKEGFLLSTQWVGWKAPARLLQGDNLVLDSCCGNAMAHQVNLMHFFAGQRNLQEWARPVEMKAELYRANAIEGFDTLFALALLESGVEFRLAVTHVCSNEEPCIVERLECEHAVVEIHNNEQVLVTHGNGATESLFYLAAQAIHDVAPLSGDCSPVEADSAMVVPGLEEAAVRLLADGLLPSEAGVSWAQKGGEASIREISNLRSTVETLRDRKSP